jgi:GNAT superfamily N-acetyltransferase
MVNSIRFGPIRPIGEGDIEACLALSREAHWNQTAADWRFFFHSGWPVGVDDQDGRLVASAAGLPLGPALAWISMVLVTERARRRGLATSLLRDRIAAIAETGRVAGLDATPAGREVYRPLGFKEIFSLSRLRGTVTDPVQPPNAAWPSVRAATADDLPALLALDRAAMGGERAELLAHLMGRRPDLALAVDGTDGPVGFCLARDGRTATQLGPIVARDPAVAEALVSAALARLAGQAVIIDLNDHQADLHRQLLTHGFAVERPFYRMTRGAPPAHDPSLYIAAAGPELA